ncbi:hypothetical protein ACSRUE_29425 [Sorangium sp. KYC3313]|uniref:hypothetical protein n=1 Tax=Sorangium sp. KYC3313 TaxID=3449740 RepID=UPI003F88EF5D
MPSDSARRFRPDLLGLAWVAKRLRDTVMVNGPQPPSDILSGHDERGGPSQRPHAAYVPLANVGWEHADGELLGMALVLPRELSPHRSKPAMLDEVKGSPDNEAHRSALVDHA